MPQVHPTAILEGQIDLADDVVIGPGCVLTGPITLGPGCKVIGNAYLHGPLVMGADNTVYPFACIGFAPQHARFDPAKPGPGTVIGDGNTFRESATVHRAFADDRPTTIGNHNLFMVYSHAGHDSTVGDHCTFVNSSALGGHVVVGDRVTFGGTTGAHQFVRIGTGAMLTGGTAVTNNVLPWFMLTAFNVCASLNLVGMRRNGFTSDQIKTVKWVFATLNRAELSLTSRINALRQRADDELVSQYIAFIDASERPLALARGKANRGTG